MRATHTHGPTAALLDPVWCLSCGAEHIATIPQVTFVCADCGFGSWTDQVAGAHAVNLPDHVVFPLHHATTCHLPDEARATHQPDATEETK